jgi:hypothetical protein
MERLYRAFSDDLSQRIEVFITEKGNRWINITFEELPEGWYKMEFRRLFLEIKDQILINGYSRSYAHIAIKNQGVHHQ